MPRLQTFDAWIVSRDYRLLWVGNFFANTANWLQLLTLGWLVQHLTKDTGASALLVIGVGGINTLPGLIIGPLGGVLGDRVDRRRLIIFLQAFMAIFSFGFAWVVHLQYVEVWHVFAYAIVSGACLSITQPMRQALIANTVPRHMLGNAYATNVLTIPGTRAIGPFIGGILVATLGFFWNFTIESLLYLGMIVAFLPMRTSYASVSRRRPAAGTGGFFTDLIEGFRYIWSGNRVLFFLITLTIVPNVILQPVIFALPLFTDEILKRGADVGGYMLAINGFGGFLMALTIASFGFFFKRGMVCLATRDCQLHTRARPDPGCLAPVSAGGDCLVRFDPDRVQDHQRHSDPNARAGRTAGKNHEPSASRAGFCRRIEPARGLVRRCHFGDMGFDRDGAAWPGRVPTLSALCRSVEGAGMIPLTPVSSTGQALALSHRGLRGVGIEPGLVESPPS